MKRLLLFLSIFTAFFGSGAFIAGCNSGAGEEENGDAVVNDTLPYPASVTASLDPNAFVILQWEEVPGAVDYYVFRSNNMNAADENYILLGSTDGDAFYADEHPWKGDNYYKIQAIGESATGEPVEGRKNPFFDAQCAYSFDAPSNVTARLQGGMVTIDWGAVQGSNITYSVFRSATLGGTSVRLNSGPLSVRTFVDENPLSGWNYYCVQASSPSLGVSEYSASASIEYLVSDGIFVGLMAFSDDVTVTNPISNDLESMRGTISSLTRGQDATALCYAVSSGIKLFDDPALPAFDNIYIVSFTDGYDNFSGGLYGDVAQAQVFDKANGDLVDLSISKNLISYAIGFGSDPNADDMKKLVVGIDPSEGYRRATDSNLGPVFTDVANSVLATAQNVYLETNSSIYTDLYPKFFRINVTAKYNTVTYPNDYVIGKLGDNNMFSIVKSGDYLTFDAPVVGILTGKKIRIPLKNFKFTVNGVNGVVEQKQVMVSTKPAGPEGYPPVTDFHTDAEDGGFSEIQDVEKKIAVVLVLDCSSSLGGMFQNVKQFANEFISILARVK